MVDTLELRRRSDALVYRFHRIGPPEAPIYRREDRDRAYLLTWRDGFGWGAWDGDQLQGRPWQLPGAEQSRAAPPEGLWVSQKGQKAYAYDLVHLGVATTQTDTGDPDV